MSPLRRWFHAARDWLVACSAALVFAHPALAASDARQMLEKADGIKTAQNAQFMSILQSLEGAGAELSLADRDFLRYLQAWQRTYEGDYAAAVPLLKQSMLEAQDATLRFRARATLINLYALSMQYHSALTELSVLLESLPSITDRDVREQGLVVAALLYNVLGQYDLGLQYADQLLAEDWGGRGACKGGQLRLEALSKSNSLQSPIAQLQEGIDACDALCERVHANVIRLYMARWFMSQNRYEDALQVLNARYAEVVEIGSPRIVSEYQSSLAEAYRETGNAPLARQFALRAIANSVTNEYAESLVTAYRLLYLLAKEQGDTKQALAYHERHAAADKGYLDHISARQLAYQRVKHEVDATRLQVEALNRQNQVLQLQQQLDRKGIENIRLYIALLLLVLVFIGLFAYKTKRSQLHFMKLSRRDGLTGIFNRPHFMELAGNTLQECRKLGQSACVVLCDLDHFKSVNDKFGHAEGDSVLQRAVEVIQAQLRGSDIFARIGGEEFGILLASCTLEDARTRAEHLRAAVAAMNAVYGPTDDRSNVSASFGIAGTQQTGFDLRQLMVHADAALYQAKRAGRNRVMVYDPEAMSSAPARLVYVDAARA